MEGMLGAELGAQQFLNWLLKEEALAETAVLDVEERSK